MLRPMGLALIIPVRNSTKVPLVTANQSVSLNDVAVVPCRLIGISNLAMQCRMEQAHKRIMLVFDDAPNKQLRQELSAQVCRRSTRSQ